MRQSRAQSSSFDATGRPFTLAQREALMGKHGKAGRSRRLRALCLGTVAAAAAVVALPTMASASTPIGLTNPGFETGTTAGWAGSGVATTGYEGYTAPDGQYFAVVLGGCPTNTLGQSFTATADQTLTGWSFFKANDYQPFNDSGSVRLSVTGGGTTATVFSSSINQVGSYGGTPWQKWSYTVPADGQYTITASSSNDMDCVGSSAVGIDLAGDSTPPVITASATTNESPYTSGSWTGHDVVVHFSCTDNTGGSGVATVTPDQTVSTEGDAQSVAGTCADNAGNTASATFTGIRIDKTAPTVTYTGNAASYTVDQQVAITCNPSDALSGVATSTCANIGGPAYSFGLGSHTYTATATDNAGNQGGGTTTFTVQVSYPSLCRLASQFSTSTDVASGLCDKLSAASQAAVRGQNKPKTNILAAFDQQVSAQTGKALSSDQADVLTTLAATL
jgi:hypothetical protein